MAQNGLARAIDPVHTTADGDSVYALSVGSLRADINVSLRPAGTKELGTRTEMKNINSFKNLEDAINYELERQQEVLEDGGHVVQETRTFDPARGITLSMRSKENAHDYRYMPEPDLPPIVTSEETIEKYRSELPELPDARRARLKSALGLPHHLLHGVGHRGVVLLGDLRAADGCGDDKLFHNTPPRKNNTTSPVKIWDPPRRDSASCTKKHYLHLREPWGFRQTQIALHVTS